MAIGKPVRMPLILGIWINRSNDRTFNDTLCQILGYGFTLVSPSPGLNILYGSNTVNATERLIATGDPWLVIIDAFVTRTR